MLRQLYIIVLALHPAQFRYRFAFQMLAIYDEASAQGCRLPLFADALRSLVRQWVHPYRPVAVPAPAGAGIPVFYSLDTSPPQRRHLMTGAALSLALFSAATTLMGRGGLRSGIVIGSSHLRPSVLGLYWDSIVPARLTTEVKVGAPESPFGALDRDGDGLLSPMEIANVPAVLQSLDRNRDGGLEPPETTYLLRGLLDSDRDGTISSAEINRSTDVLRGCDTNHDGMLTLREAEMAVRENLRKW